MSDGAAGTEVVRVEVADGVATVSLNRPEKLNAVSSEVFSGLAEAGERVGADPNVRAVLLRGEGRAFCAGLDLAALQGFAGGGGGSSGGGVSRDPQAGWRIWQQIDKPVVAAVQGYALGAGFQLALAADIRFAAEDAVMSVFEITYGLVPDLGGTQFLPPIVGPAKTKELIWTAERLTATEALALGLVNHVVAGDELDAAARAFAQDLASRPPLPIRFTKRILNEAGRLSLEEGMRREIEAQATCITSNDMKEAVAAAFEKRPGTYTGT